MVGHDIDGSMATSSNGGGAHELVNGASVGGRGVVSLFFDPQNRGIGEGVMKGCT